MDPKQRSFFKKEFDKEIQIKKLKKLTKVMVTLLHYGRFGQNLSKNSRNVIFDRIWPFLIPMTLKGINKAIQIEKGQQSL